MIIFLPEQSATRSAPRIPAGYYGHVPGVGMNHAIYSRVPKDQAYELTAQEALSALRWRLGGYGARCEPPLVVTY